METLTPIVALGALVISAVNFLRYALNRDVNGAGTIATSWVGGVAATMLAAHANVAQAVPTLGGVALGDANWASQVLYGLTAASAAHYGVQLTKALDNTDSATLPKLIGKGTKTVVADQSSSTTVVIEDPPSA